MLRSLVVAVAVAVLLCSAASADMLYLRDGSFLRGTIKSYDNVKVVVTINGRDYEVPSAAVANFNYGDPLPPPVYAGGSGISAAAFDPAALYPFAGGNLDAAAYPFYGVGDVYPAARQLVVSGASANLRRGPGTEYGILGRVVEGNVLNVIGESREWYRLALLDGNQAWISKSLVRAASGPAYLRADVNQYPLNYQYQQQYLPLGVVPVDYRGMQLEALAQRVRLTYSAAEIQKLIELLKK